MRRSTLIGYILRHEGLAKTMREGKNKRDRPILDNMGQLMKDLGYQSHEELKKLAQDCKKLKSPVNQSRLQQEKKVDGLAYKMFSLQDFIGDNIMVSPKWPLQNKMLIGFRVKRRNVNDTVLD
ncbi:hypothetical protein J437_LFUL011889 [Ladona fulva]|uniref:Uncharacterized protein n=1 Tax=Ladona fulva TaxID=123851 RepID=A0A8K0KE41_LADFU|nr:hypothetical protein J437_LFUL011889 [Ladona fulva]